MMPVFSHTHAALSGTANFLTYVASLPESARHYLNQALDFDNNGVDKDLNEIAHHMLHWEEELSSYFELTVVDIHDIKAENSDKPKLQRWVKI